MKNYDCLILVLMTTAIGWGVPALANPPHVIRHNVHRPIHKLAAPANNGGVTGELLSLARSIHLSYSQSSVHQLQNTLAAKMRVAQKTGSVEERHSLGLLNRALGYRARQIQAKSVGAGVTYRRQAEGLLAQVESRAKGLLSPFQYSPPGNAEEHNGPKVIRNP